VGVRARLRSDLKEPLVSLDYWLGAVLSVVLSAYLVYALVRPERF
jgi:K+-transporting ATPase KdpF subunit